MSDINGSSVKTKNITLGSIVGWIVGVGALVAGVTRIVAEPVVGILYLLIMLFRKCLLYFKKR